MIAFILLCRRPLLLASTLFALFPQTLRAADTSPPVVVVRSRSCATAHDDAALRHALEVELAAMHVAPRWEVHDAGVAAARISLSAECADDAGVISLRVWSSVPRLLVERSIPLRDVPEAARARTLALVISEALAPALAASAGSAGSAAAAGSAGEATDEGAPSGRKGSPAASTMPVGSSAGGPLFTSADPYAPWGTLFTPTDPYVTPRAVRLAAAAQARMAVRDNSLLLAFEVGASGPLAEMLDWSVEASHAGSTTAGKVEGVLDVSWWNASIGADVVGSRGVSLAVGPRLSLGHLAIDDPYGTRTERTLVSQLGGRAKLDMPLGNRASVQAMFAAQRTLGVLALTHYTGLDRPINGWLLSWGMGLAVEL